MVLLSGHLDSWDVGQGAMDDGGGAVISWEALSLIKDLGGIHVHTVLKTQHTLTVYMYSVDAFKANLAKLKCESFTHLTNCHLI